MELKIIFYIVVAIGWVIFQNYRKIVREATNRDPRKPVTQIPHENWPSVPPAPVNQEPRPEPVPLKREVIRKQPIRRPAASFLSTDIPSVEGGTTKASAQVTFTDGREFESEYEHPWLAEFRSGMDWKKTLVATEILQRPYK